jgi:hyperosmotically inducible periplasmic protein
MNHLKLTAVSLSLLLALGLGACNKPGPAEQAGKKIDQVASDAGKKIEETADKANKSISEQSAKAGMAIDDAEITTRVKSAFIAEAGLKTLEVRVDTINGVVTLTGKVDSVTNSDKAKMLAGGVSGVHEVINHLEVAQTK